MTVLVLVPEFDHSSERDSDVIAVEELTDFAAIAVSSYPSPVEAQKDTTKVYY